MEVGVILAGSLPAGFCETFSEEEVIVALLVDGKVTVETGLRIAVDDVDVIVSPRVFAPEPLLYS